MQKKIFNFTKISLRFSRLVREYLLYKIGNIGEIDFVFFFSDPLAAQPHDPDVKALLRIAQVYDIPIANNRATADFLITSSLMNEEYNHSVINFDKNIKERANTL